MSDLDLCGCRRLPVATCRSWDEFAHAAEDLFERSALGQSREQDDHERSPKIGGTEPTPSSAPNTVIARCPYRRDEARTVPASGRSHYSGLSQLPWGFKSHVVASSRQST